jgi:hypothetical protein
MTLRNSQKRQLLFKPPEGAAATVAAPDSRRSPCQAAKFRKQRHGRGVRTSSIVITPAFAHTVAASSDPLPGQHGRTYSDSWIFSAISNFFYKLLSIYTYSECILCFSNKYSK